VNEILHMIAEEPRYQPQSYARGDAPARYAAEGGQLGYTHVGKNSMGVDVPVRPVEAATAMADQLRAHNGHGTSHVYAGGWGGTVVAGPTGHVTMHGRGTQGTPIQHRMAVDQGNVVGHFTISPQARAMLLTLEGAHERAEDARDQAPQDLTLEQAHEPQYHPDQSPALRMADWFDEQGTDEHSAIGQRIRDIVAGWKVDSYMGSTAHGHTPEQVRPHAEEMLEIHRGMPEFADREMRLVPSTNDKHVLQLESRYPGTRGRPPRAVDVLTMVATQPQVLPRTNYVRGSTPARYAAEGHPLGYTHVGRHASGAEETLGHPNMAPARLQSMATALAARAISSGQHRIHEGLVGNSRDWPRRIHFMVADPQGRVTSHLRAFNLGDARQRNTLGDPDEIYPWVYHDEAMQAHQQGVASGSLFSHFHISPEAAAHLRAIDAAHEQAREQSGGHAHWRQPSPSDPRGWEITPAKPVDAAPALQFADYLHGEGSHEHAVVAQKIRDRIANWQMRAGEFSEDDARKKMAELSQLPQYRGSQWRIGQNPRAGTGNELPWVVEEASRRGTPPTVAEILQMIAEEPRYQPQSYARGDAPARYVGEGEQPSPTGETPEQKQGALWFLNAASTHMPGLAIRLRGHMTVLPGYLDDKPAAIPHLAGWMAERHAAGDLVRDEKHAEALARVAEDAATMPHLHRHLFQPGQSIDDVLARHGQFELRKLMRVHRKGRGQPLWLIEAKVSPSYGGGFKWGHEHTILHGGANDAVLKRHGYDPKKIPRVTPWRKGLTERDRVAAGIDDPPTEKLERESQYYPALAPVVADLKARGEPPGEVYDALAAHRAKVETVGRVPVKDREAFLRGVYGTGGRPPVDELPLKVAKDKLPTPPRPGDFIHLVDSATGQPFLLAKVLPGRSAEAQQYPRTPLGNDQDETHYHLRLSLQHGRDPMEVVANQYARGSKPARYAAEGGQLGYTHHGVLSGTGGGTLDPTDVRHVAGAANAAAEAMLHIKDPASVARHPFRHWDFFADPHGNVTAHPHGVWMAHQAAGVHNTAVQAGRLYGHFNIGPEARAHLLAMDAARTEGHRRAAAIGAKSGVFNVAGHTNQAPALAFADWLDEHEGATPEHSEVAQKIREKIANWRLLDAGYPSAEAARAAIPQLRQDVAPGGYKDFRIVGPEVRTGGRREDGSSPAPLWDIQGANHYGVPPNAAEVLRVIAEQEPVERHTYARGGAPTRYDFDPNEARDAAGMWTAGSGGEGSHGGSAAAVGQPAGVGVDDSADQVGDDGEGDADAIDPDVRGWAAQLHRLPAHLAGKARDFALQTFYKFEKRYGRKAAIAMIGGAVALLPVPVPGVSILGPVAVAEGVLAVKRLLRRARMPQVERYAMTDQPPADGDFDAQAAAQEFVQGLYEIAGEQFETAQPQVSQNGTPPPAESYSARGRAARYAGPKMTRRGTLQSGAVHYQTLHSNPRGKLRTAAAQADPEPTEAQRLAGNARLGHIHIHGLDISIEVADGGKRSGVDRHGERWEHAISGAHYGYLRRQRVGADGDAIDVFVGPHPRSEIVFVLDQKKHDGSGRFDEHKAFIGYTNAKTVRRVYKDSHPLWRKTMGDIHAVTMDGFKRWLANGDTTKRFAGQAKDYARDDLVARYAGPPAVPNPAAAPATPAAPVFDVEGDIRRLTGLGVPREMAVGVALSNRDRHAQGKPPNTPRGFTSVVPATPVPAVPASRLVHMPEPTQPLLDRDYRVHPMSPLVSANSRAGEIAEHVRHYERMTPYLDTLGHVGRYIHLSPQEAQLSSIPILNNEKLPQFSPRAHVVDVVHHINDKSRAALGGVVDMRTPEGRQSAHDHLVRMMTAEGIAALHRPAHQGLSGNEWYRKNLKEAVAIAKLMHPEIVGNPHLEAAFLMSLAVTSNGLSVEDNTKFAEKVFNRFKKSYDPKTGYGRFPVIGQGERATNMKDAFRELNGIINRGGMDKALEFLHERATAGELREMGYQITGDLGDEEPAYGSAVVGPKIGNGFYSNLRGMYDMLTPDRWFRRTMGRYLGTMIDDRHGKVEGQMGRLRRALVGPNGRVLPEAKAHATINELLRDPAKFGYTLKDALADPAHMANLAHAIYRHFANTEYHERNEINRAARQLHKSVAEPQDNPGDAPDRRAYRLAMEQAARNVRAMGHPNVNVADLQALLWFPEKDLYRRLGYDNPRMRPNDYSQALQRLAAGRGKTAAEIEGAIQGA
jgi:hypothetical protein